MAVTAQAAIISSPDINATLINQEPDPAAPGDTVDVQFRVENDGGEPARDMEVKVVPKYPFTLYDASQGAKRIGTLASRQTADLGVRVKFTLLVDASAAPGENEIELWYRFANGPWVKEGDYPLTVRSRQAAVGISKISASPSPLAPGSTSKVVFTIDNFAGSAITDVKLNLELYKVYTSTTGFTEKTLPFTPIGSSNEKTLNRIDAGKSATLSFDLFTDADAASQAYKVPFTLGYADTSGKNSTRIGIVGLVVDAAPDVSISIDSSTAKRGAEGTIAFKFVNKGFSDVKFLTVTLKETQEFDLLGNKEVYIGELDSDDYETAEFPILVTDGKDGTIDLPLHAEYRDANGKLYERDVVLSARTDTKRQGGSAWVGVLIVILIIGAGVAFYIHRKRKKKHHAA
ncbi:MAG: hypothetical protein Q7S65_00240 [Nanoarchaeota archaeon]|nr:hypothetical protein [Nanoarchaeota archaeon]